MIDDRKNLIVGCLLHDIGKFIQRANDNPASKTHQEFGYTWIEDNLPKTVSKIISAIALSHHSVRGLKKDELSVFSDANKSNITLIAYESDNLSSKERKEYDEESEDFKWQKEQPLYSVFSKISLHHGITPSYNDCWKAVKLSSIHESIIFPCDNYHLN